MSVRVENKGGRKGVEEFLLRTRWMGLWICLL